MTKTIRSDVEPFYYQYPSTVAVVSSRSRSRSNAMAVAWHTTISRRPPRYGVLIFPDTFTHELILESNEFVVNFMTIESANLIARLGGCSGREVDKFEAFEIAATSGSTVSAPVLEAAYASYECRVFSHQEYGDHDLFVGDVVAVQFEDSAYSMNGTTDIRKVTPVAYVGEDRYASINDPVYHDRHAL